MARSNEKRGAEEFALHEAGFMVVRMLQTWPGLYVPEANKPMPAVGEERQKLTLVISSADGCRLVLQRQIAKD